MQAIAHTDADRALRDALDLLRSGAVKDSDFAAVTEAFRDAQAFEQAFEALVAEITAKFINNFEPSSERCWIAEMDGAPVGSVFLVRKSKTVAQLRLLIVDPRARGLGIGNRLVAECIRFARERGYKKVTLWTQSILIAARQIYAQAGFRMVTAKEAHGFGHDPASDEIWELKLK